MCAGFFEIQLAPRALGYTAAAVWLASCVGGDPLTTGALTSEVAGNTIRVAVTQGGPNPSPLPVTLANAGSCAVDYAAEAMTSDGQDWLGIDPVAGTVVPGGVATLDVGIDVVTPGLDPGTYTGSLVISGQCSANLRPAAGSPLLIAVNVLVTPSAAMFTVGGAVTGLSGDGLILQNNAADLLAIDEDGPFAFPAAAGSPYAVTVAQQPAGAPCTVHHGTGMVAGASVTDVSVECGVDVGPLYGGPDLYWNDYVVNDGLTSFDATGTACDGTEAGFYNRCLHSAEMLAFEVVGRTECTDLSAEDALGAFNWVCLRDTPWARMASVSLKDERRLADLIDTTATPEWRANSVTVFDDGTPILTTNTSVWWVNPLEVPVFGAFAVVLDTPGTIYVVPEDTTGKALITGSQVGLVIMPGATLSGGGNIIETTPGVSRLWLEGSFWLLSNTTALALYGMNRSVVRHVDVSHGDIGLADATGNRLVDLYVAKGRDNINTNSAARFNVIERATTVGFTMVGLLVRGQNNVIHDVVAAHGRIAIRLLGEGAPATSNVLFDSITACAGSTGFWVVDASRSTIMNHVSLDMNAAVSVGLSTDVLFHNIAAANTMIDDAPTPGRGIALGASSTATFPGKIVVGNNAVGEDCIYLNVSVPCDSLPGASSDNVTTGVTLEDAFVADAVTADSNPDSTGSTALFDDISHWVDFDSRYRGWGREPETYPFPSDEAQDECELGTCRIWDWRASAGDALLRTTLERPIGADARELVHIWDVADPGECATVSGATWSGTSCESTFVNNAVELSRDGVGNDNLLCEAEERCLITENIGAYQGHGPLVFVGLGGVASNVYLYRYSSNGIP